MKAVLIGDISWPDLYHLGDEAMTEAAIDMLRARGFEDITLVAGNPGVAEEFYGLPAVRRVRFRGDWSRGRNEWRLADVARVLAEQDWDDHPIYPAIRDADAVIIAGGGNMNSRDYHLLFERVAAKRIAEHFGVPLYITSQTVGPMLDEPDRALIVELLTYARAFGAREQTTHALLKDLAPDPTTVFQTLDDAILLEADDAARTAAREIAGDRPYVAASFTDHPGNSWSHSDAYRREISAICAKIARDLDVDVLLIPHAGSFLPDDLQRDQRSDREVVRYADDPRVRATRMVTAREDIALIAGAVASLSTRYHPTVFAGPARTPAVAIAPSHYSSVRMRGSLQAVGLGAFVVPALFPDAVVEAIREAQASRKAIAAHLAEASAVAVLNQNTWWDAIVASIRANEPITGIPDAHPAVAWQPQGSWSREVEAARPYFERWARGQDALTRAEQDLSASQTRGEELGRALASTRADLKRLRGRKVIKFADALTPRQRAR